MSELRLPRSLYDDIVAHARAEAPNECCGMLGAVDGRAVQVLRARNIHNSPLRYEVHPQDLLRHLDAIEEARQDLVIYHSHTRSDPVPSQTDINQAVAYPYATYVIVGVKGSEDDVRAWTIRDGGYQPVELLVE